MKGITVPLALLALLALPAAAAAQTFSGEGQQATRLFPLAAGLVVFEMEHPGEGPFGVRLLDAQGELVDTLAAATGPFRGSRAVRVPRAGDFLLDVTAAGAWTVRLREEERSGAPLRTTDEERLRSHGRFQGQQAANRVPTARYLLGGFLGGAVAGPLGAGVSFALSTGRDAVVPAEVEQSIADREPTFREEFREAYRARVRGNRRTAALVGGATGSAVFLFVIAQTINWSGGTGGSGGGGGGGGGET